MALDIRTIDDTDLTSWVTAMRTGFLVPAEPTKEEVEVRGAGMELARTQGAFDAGRCVATFRSHPQRLTAPGGAQLAVNAITNVTVSPTHRRRGVLSRMMARDLAAAKERGDAAATLVAAEYPIYGRFGFGPATTATRWEVHIARSGFDGRYAGPACGGRVDFADGATVREHGPGLHERLRAARHGVVDRTERWWRFATGDLPSPMGWKEPFHVLYRSPEGRVDGLLTYDVEEQWTAMQPENKANVRDLVAVSPAAERALWHFLLSVDWITAVATRDRAPDDLLPLLLPDPRAARLTSQADHLWLRPLDVPALLAARTYAAEGSLVLEVTDPDGYAAGRYLLDAGPEGAACTTTSRDADLTLGAGALASLYLGDESAVRLAAAGLVTEERPGAAARADLLLRTPLRPWCPDVF
ncbi:GNAT family N-acetyltransferase [Streptomyces huiliensis]|uniref:GNAT family N-acetyltransferase n=1 Tax=Streptomyces huiliensis TaxID=2876027 RepID=UPI001CBDF03E|nr:GNAT family N-acetyltransferase [Streptomyces huiliensis]MBZ4319156.1 GNAT family N-acetyltransferase [Streptomyces huiliensis]